MAWMLRNYEENLLTKTAKCHEDDALVGGILMKISRGYGEIATELSKEDVLAGGILTKTSKGYENDPLAGEILAKISKSYIVGTLMKALGCVGGLLAMMGGVVTKTPERYEDEALIGGIVNKIRPI